MSANVEPYRLQPIRETRNASLSLFDHPHAEDLPKSFSAHEPVRGYQINVVQRGFFRLRYGRREWTLGPDTVFLARPADEYRYSHVSHAEPDTCLRLEFSAVREEELSEILDDRPLVLPPTNRLAWLRLQLARVGKNDPELALDSIASELIDAVRGTTGASSHLYRGAQLKWYGQRIGAARELLHANPAAGHSLWQLASEVSMSPFQFARVFRELVGVPPHQYLVQLRLQRARELLKSGTSVTEACYAAGFNNLSHFVRSFHRAFGVPPSRLKQPDSSRRQ